MKRPSRERWLAISPHLGRALELSGAEREAFLDELTVRDATLAADLRALLAEEEGVERDPLLGEARPFEDLLASGVSARAGQTLGAYTLEAPLGEGGMGTVWLARRSDGSYEGKVAVKLVRAGLDSKGVLKRFESERQALALMNHPHIARVLDAGTAPDSRPFFVMEYVEGRALTDYCDEKRLGIRDRLVLFLDVCDGVQHAHRNGIIHRDLKPSNILVTEQDGRPVAKIIDFGIAKAVAARTADASVLTRQGDWVGTPAYMSPEQVSTTGRVDTRSDVYSLGVVLYELLAGVRPPAPWRGAAEEIDRADTPPSARFAALGAERTEAAARRDTDAAKLRRALEGELDWIVVKAIEREPDRRYESAAALARDIRAFLEDEPLQAGPPTLRYRARKFVRRHRAAVAATAGIGAALLFGAAIAVVGYSRAVLAERTAAAERDKTAAINSFLKKILSSADPYGGSGKDTTVIEALAAATKRVETAFPDQPAIRGAVLQTIGDTYQQLGRIREASPLLREAIEIRRRLGPAAEPELADSLTSLGDGLTVVSEFQEAQRLLEESLAIERRLFPAGSESLARTLTNLGDVDQRTGGRDVATRYYQEAVAMYRRLLGPDDPQTLVAETRLAQCLLGGADLDQAESILRDVVTRQRRLEPEDPRRAEALDDLSGLLDERSQLPEAEQVAREALSIRRKALGPQHPDTCDSLMGLAWILRRRGHLDEAESLLREAIENDRAGGRSSFSRAAYLSDLAGVLKERGDLSGAGAAYEEALEIYRRDGGPDHPNVATTLLNLGLLKVSAKDLPAAESLLRRALQIMLARFGAASRDVADVREALADTLARMKRWDDALDQANQALASFSATLGADNENTLRCRAHRATYLWRSGKTADAERELRAVHDRALSLYGASNEVTVASAGSLAGLLRATNRADEAARYSRTAGN